MPIKDKNTKVNGVQAQPAAAQYQDCILGDYTAVYFNADGCGLQTSTIKILNYPQAEPHIRPFWLGKEESSQIFNIDCEGNAKASCNILPFYRAKPLFGENISLGPSAMYLRGYNDSPFKNLSSCIVVLHQGIKKYGVLCDVADSKGHKILGREQSLSITINGKTYPFPATKEYLLREYADLLQGIGTLPGRNYHIPLKKDFKPIQHSPKQVAVSLKPAYKVEHDRLQNLASSQS